MSPPVCFWVQKSTINFSQVPHLKLSEYLHYVHHTQLVTGKCWFMQFSLLLCGHKCNNNSVLFEFDSSQKQDPLHFDCPSFRQLEYEIPGNPRTFFYPQKELNIPTPKGLSLLTLNAMGTWPRKAESHCIIQLPIYWRQYI